MNSAGQDMRGPVNAAEPLRLARLPSTEYRLERSNRNSYRSHLGLAMQAHIQLIQLIVAYSLLGAFLFAVAITCGSLVGWVKFSSPSQQRKLFAVLIVQICVFGVGFFANVLKFDPVKVQQEILRDYMTATVFCPGIRFHSFHFRYVKIRGS